jgi:hypothetical protein
MRSGRLRGNLRGVSSESRLTFVLEVDPGSKPISGRLTGENRGPVQFGGWLGLAEALERLIEGPSATSPQVDRRGEKETGPDKEKDK